MQNMRKLKEDALRRKHEFEEKQRTDELRKERKMAGGRPRPRPDRRRAGAQQPRTQGSASQRRNVPAARPQMRKKAKRSPARWVIDTLLVLGTLIALVMLFNPY